MSTATNGNGLASEALPEASAPAPSANGSDGRDGRGRFTKGNKGGSGNPFNRRIAELRRAMLDAVTEQDLRDIIVQLIIKARMGDVAAAKLVLSYVIGKPAETVHPDRLDLEEWQLNEERPTHADLEETLMGRCPADIANSLTVGMSVARRLEVRQLLGVDQPSASPAEELRRWSSPDTIRRGGSDRSSHRANGRNGKAGPSRNGGNGRKASR